MPRTRTARPTAERRIAGSDPNWFPAQAASRWEARACNGTASGRVPAMGQAEEVTTRFVVRMNRLAADSRSAAVRGMKLTSPALAMLVCGCLSVLKIAVELALHRRDVDDVLVAPRSPQHQRLEPRVEHERGDGVDEVDLEELDRGDLGERRAANCSSRAGRPAAVRPGRGAPTGKMRWQASTVRSSTSRTSAATEQRPARPATGSPRDSPSTARGGHPPAGDARSSIPAPAVSIANVARSKAAAARAAARATAACASASIRCGIESRAADAPSGRRC